MRTGFPSSHIKTVFKYQIKNVLIESFLSLGVLVFKPALYLSSKCRSKLQTKHPTTELILKMPGTIYSTRGEMPNLQTANGLTMTRTMWCKMKPINVPLKIAQATPRFPVLIGHHRTSEASMWWDYREKSNTFRPLYSLTRSEPSAACVKGS